MHFAKDRREAYGPLLILNENARNRPEILWIFPYKSDMIKVSIGIRWEFEACYEIE